MIIGVNENISNKVSVWKNITFPHSSFTLYALNESIEVHNISPLVITKKCWVYRPTMNTFQPCVFMIVSYPTRTSHNTNSV